MILSRPIKSYVRISDRWDPPRHYGLDLSAYVGTEVYAAISGIAYVLTQPSGFGLYVRIQQVVDGITWYVYTAHLDSVCIASARGDTVTPWSVAVSLLLVACIAWLASRDNPSW